jgi:DNA (cytosine-5)-methyltransferase 1
MNFISLFAGIGGFDLGFERAGMQCVAQVEKDPFCQKVLQKHWPHVLRYGDVKDVGKHNLPTADIICGGFPCQPHSNAGKRRGKEDDRNLWPEYLRIVDELRPQYVVGENVVGIITTILDEIISDLENIGYTCQTFIIPACAFNAPHRRDRVFIIAKNSNSNGTSIGKIEKPGKERIIGNTSTGNDERIYLQPNSHSNSSRSLQGKFETQSGEGREYAQHVASTVDWNENWLEIATRLCRVDDGIPRRVDRLRSLGNAVVPQVTEFIARSILQAESAPNKA